MDKSDSQLILEYLNGDAEAIEHIVAKYLKPLYNFALRQTGSPEDAQDIVQETFVKVWRNIKKYDKEKSFKVWIWSIARNVTIDWQRKRKIPVSYFNSEDGDFVENNIPDTGPLQDELFEIKETKESLEKILLKIPPDRREIVILHYNNGLTFEEIALILDKPMNTVKSNHRRAMITLRKHLQSEPKNSAPK